MDNSNREYSSKRNWPSKVDLSIFVAAYNEVRSLEKVIEELAGVEGSLGKTCEIVIVDDGSDDGTGELADRLATIFSSVRVIHHGTNLGLGGFYRTAFSNFRGRFITFYPADGQAPASIIHQFIPIMDNYHMVLGYLTDRQVTLPSRMLSWMEKIFYRLLFGSFPRFQGIIMFRSELLEHFELKSGGRGWAVLMELILRTTRGGYKIISVPTRLRPRKSGSSKVNNLSTIWSSIKQVLVLRSKF